MTAETVGLASSRDSAGEAGSISVVVFTPLGWKGRGGIDRMMDELRASFPASRSDVAARFVTTRGPGHIVWSPFFLLCAMAQLCWLKLRGKADVVHINLASGGSVYRKLPLGALCHVLGVPYVLHLHGAEFHKFWDGASPWLDRALTRLFARAAAIIVLGNVWARYINRRLRSADDRIVILPNASRRPSAQSPAPAKTGINIVFLGQLGARKGVPQLVAALDRIRGNAEWRATIAGDGEVTKTKSDVERLGLSDRIAIPGWVGDAQVQALLAAADVLVLPSFDENLPMSVVEACAHGLAIVTTPVGAVEDIIQNDENGLLVQPGNVDQLAAALARLVEAPELRARLGRNARAVYEDRLNLDAYTRRLLETWRNAAAIHKQHKVRAPERA